MPTERIAMRKVREILRLTFDGGLPSREVARRVGVGSTGVRVMLQRFRASALTWPLPDVMTDTALERELYGVAATRSGQRERAEPDWSAVNRELKRKHVTLQVLWDEYIEDHPAGYSYSRYCFLYRTWEGRLPVTMRQTHLGGETQRQWTDKAIARTTPAFLGFYSLISLWACDLLTSTSTPYARCVVSKNQPDIQRRRPASALGRRH